METLKRAVDIARGLFLASRLRRHDRWTPDELKSHQGRALRALVAHAKRWSPFYAELYDQIDPRTDVDIGSLPVIDKHTVLENFDRVVVDRRLRLADLRAHIGGIGADDYYLGRYRVLATAGTSGVRGLFVYDRRAWSVVIANTLRWQRFIGIRPKLSSRTRICTIGADHPVHVSRRIPLSGDVGLFHIRHLAATDPLGSIVEALNAFQPDVVLSYPSVAMLLAHEQIQGRLAIAPRIVSTHSELLTGEMADLMEKAWGTRPFDHYGLTEEPHAAIECQEHQGMHALEDLCIIEIVDENDRPVAPGIRGRKCLLTNLYNRTLPLIRYEVSDMLVKSDRRCPCGRPFALIEAVQGRSEDMLRLHDQRGGEVVIAPPVLLVCVESFAEIREYEIRSGARGVDVTAVADRGADRSGLCNAIRGRIAETLSSHGAVVPPVSVRFVDSIERSRERMGKARPLAVERGMTSGVGAAG